MKEITVKEVEYLAFTLARERWSFKEPIPNFGTRFPNILESCLATPFQSFGRKSLYPSLLAKASILFYLLIKNHPFQNGNKRIAMTTLFVFLAKNNKWLSVDTQGLYNFTLWITNSPAELKAETVVAIEKYFKNCLVSF
ncbi:MAG: death on curing protein [Candidatus Saganbacteria bacterium]|uniref:Death on curing protein n=1 Tax=Candidatus Saganbacteria bacterium TaxID=2575572 RepID=A0A833L0W0_UNCSA|nr:MAG: death on curing protein [Candidatus Saganbacteria bacterium]